MGTPRTTDTAWESSRTATRGVSTTVAERRARALSKDRGPSKDRVRRQPPQSSGEPNEAARNFFGLLWIALGALVIVLCVVFVAGSVVMFGVLREISDARNYDAAAGRVGDYEDFFKGVADAGFTVSNDKPNIKDGVTSYLWTVQPPNDGPLRVFSWQHYLQTNEIRPTSNAAALLDIELGYLTAQQAEQYSRYTVTDASGNADSRQLFQFDQSDPTIKAILDRNTSAFARNNPGGWSQNAVGPMIASNAPPLPPPLFDPRSRSRKGVGNVATAADEEQEADAQDPTAEGDGDKAAAPPAQDEKPEPAQPEPPTEVQPQPEPPAEGGAGGGDKPKPEPPPEDPGDGDATPVK